MCKGSGARAFLSKPIPRPPTVVLVAAAIVLGVASTVAVSWLLAYCVDGSKTARWRHGFRIDVASEVVRTATESPQQTGVDFAEVIRARRWGTDIVEVWLVWAGDGRPPYGSPHLLVEGTSFEAEMNGKFDRGEAPTAWWRADGWPLPALSAEARWSWYGAKGVSSVVHGVLVGSRQVLPYDGVRMLPLQPIWSGLVIDTVLYASLWFALFSLGNIRSTLRRNRGLCAHCGYKLRPEQTRCSECGKDVLNRAVGTS